MTTQLHCAVQTPEQTLIGSDEAGLIELAFPNLATAVAALVGTIRSDEAAKVRMARIVDAIDRQQLYREAGVDTMKAFYPHLLSETAKVGWKSDTSIKRYLAWYRLYIQQLGLNGDEAIKAVSHLHNLKVLAEQKKDGLAGSPDKDGKLGAVQFEDISRLVVALVTQPTKDQQVSGLDENATDELLRCRGVTSAQRTFEALIGRKVVLPVGGWSLADTQEIIDRVRGAEEEETTKVVRRWRCERTIDGRVFAKKLQFWLGELLKEVYTIERDYSSDEFNLLSKGDKVIFEGEEEE